jgi:DNA polymerase (family 10)
LGTGSLSILNDLLEKTPEGILELLKIKGIGPKKIATIWHELGIESPGELIYACEENRLIHYKGFGEKSQQSIYEACTYYVQNQNRFLYASIEPIVLSLKHFLHTIFEEDKIAITGAFSRQEDSIDTIEVVVQYSEEEMVETLSPHASLDFVKEEDGVLFYTLNKHIPVQFILAEEESFLQTVFYTRNTAEFNDAFDECIEEVDFTKIQDANEEEIFEQIGMPYIPACLRYSALSLELAKKNQLPPLITVEDIKGIIHNHSTWSDGAFSIEEMANACIQKGFEYLVMSDHSVSSFYANGLQEERILLQHEEINTLNKKLHPFKIFKSIECDILGDGRLDYNDTVLASFDLVIASIHQHLKMTEEKAMQRLLGAIQHPATRILGHPSGRLLLSRKAYPVNYKVLLDACKEYDVVIEINANPRRLDIDWQWIQYAIQQGVLLSINPDAHSIKGIDDIRYGVLSAQKGFLTAASNLSSYSLLAFEEFLLRKKQKTNL